MITEALLNVSLEGLGKNNITSIFPCGIFQYMKDVNDKPGTPNYDLYRLALKSTAQRVYPNYVNCQWSNDAGYDKNNPAEYPSTMGCRTYTGVDANGLGHLKDGRGNCNPVTIILPTLAMISRNKIMKKYDNNESYKDHSIEIFNEFMKLLTIKIEDAKNTLLERYYHICSQSPKSGKFMYENNVIAGYDGKNIESAMKHMSLAMGQLGMAETLQIIFGFDHTCEQGMEYAKQIEQLYLDKCKCYKKEYSLNFGVYMTPAENLAFTSFKKFKKQFGEIENVTYYIDKNGERQDKKYFTNSIHVPVYANIDCFKKIDIESQLTSYSQAGCITYVELPSSAKHNIDALEKIVNYAMDKDIPYFAINCPIDRCLDCNYTDEINDVCPKCGSKRINRLRRVTGYITGNYTDAFNEGKQREVEQRISHVGDSQLNKCDC